MFGRVSERTLPVLASGCPLPFCIAIGPIVPYLFLGLHHSRQGQMSGHRFICPHETRCQCPTRIEHLNLTTSLESQYALGRRGLLYRRRPLL